MLVYIHPLSSDCCSFPPCLYLHGHVLNAHGCSSQNSGEITAAQKSIQKETKYTYVKHYRQINCLKHDMHITYITDGAEIYKLTDFVLHEVLMKHGEENHL